MYSRFVSRAATSAQRFPSRPRPSFLRRFGRSRARCPLPRPLPSSSHAPSEPCCAPFLLPPVPSQPCTPRALFRCYAERPNHCKSVPPRSLVLELPSSPSPGRSVPVPCRPEKLDCALMMLRGQFLAGSSLKDLRIRRPEVVTERSSPTT